MTKKKLINEELNELKQANRILNSDNTRLQMKVINLENKLKEINDSGFCLGCSDEFQDSSCGDCNRDLEVRRKQKRSFKELKEKADKLVDGIEVSEDELH